MANLFYRDVKYLSDVVINLWMFASAVVYPTDKLGSTLQTVLSLNPMTAIVNGYRDVLIKGTMPDMVTLGIAAGLSLVLLAIGWITFHRLEYQFAEYV